MMLLNVDLVDRDAKNLLMHQLMKKFVTKILQNDLMKRTLQRSLMIRNIQRNLRKRTIPRNLMLRTMKRDPMIRTLHRDLTDLLDPNQKLLMMVVASIIDQILTVEIKGLFTLVSPTKVLPTTGTMLLHSSSSHRTSTSVGLIITTLLEWMKALVSEVSVVASVVTEVEVLQMVVVVVVIKVFHTTNAILDTNLCNKSVLREVSLTSAQSQLEVELSLTSESCFCILARRFLNRICVLKSNGQN